MNCICELNQFPTTNKFYYNDIGWFLAAPRLYLWLQLIYKTKIQLIKFVHFECL